MKQLFTSLFFALMVTAASAQVVDTILFENFQVDKFPDWGTVPFGDDTTWVSLDEDGLNPYDSDDSHRAWYYSDFFYNETDTITGEVNYCAASLSYMEGFAIGNRNWLITPPLHITDANFTLHWKSAPFQLPRYLDGCLVMASTGSNDVFLNAFTDTLYQIASMESITGEGESVLIENFAFTPGYIHGDSLRNEDYFDLWGPGDSTLMHGILEPHSISLAQYAGQTIYLAFLHNSDDDYFFAVDDILVTKSTTSGTSNINVDDFRFVTYPNPVANWLNVLYRLPEPMMVAVRVTDMTGKTILTTNPHIQQAGEQQTNLQLSQMPSGSYNLSLYIGDQILSKVFVKK